MPFLTKEKTNWKYILIVVILAAIVGGGILGYLRYFKREISSLSKFSEIKKPEKPKIEEETTDWKIYSTSDYEIKYPKDWGIQGSEVSVMFGLFGKPGYIFYLTRVGNPQKLGSKEYGKWWLEYYKKYFPWSPVSYESEKETLVGSLEAYEFYGVSGVVGSGEKYEIIFLAQEGNYIVYEFKFPIEKFHPNVVDPKENNRKAHLMLSTFRLLR
jgi:hypothetical protein